MVIRKAISLLFLHLNTTRIPGISKIMLYTYTNTLTDTMQNTNIAHAASDWRVSELNGAPTRRELPRYEITEPNRDFISSDSRGTKH